MVQIKGPTKGHINIIQSGPHHHFISGTASSFLIPITHIFWIFDWHTTINSQCYKLHCGQVFYNHFRKLKRYLTYTTIACRLCFSQSVTRSNSFDWQNTQEKNSGVNTAHQSTKRLTLPLGILKLCRITWPFLQTVLEYKIIICNLPPCRREKIPPMHIQNSR